MSGLQGTAIETLIVFPPVTVDVTVAEADSAGKELVRVAFAASIALDVGPEESFT